MKKKLLVAVLSLSMVLTLMPSLAFATDVSAEEVQNTEAVAPEEQAEETQTLETVESKSELLTEEEGREYVTVDGDEYRYFIFNGEADPEEAEVFNAELGQPFSMNGFDYLDLQKKIGDEWDNTDEADPNVSEIKWTDADGNVVSSSAVLKFDKVQESDLEQAYRFSFKLGDVRIVTIYVSLEACEYKHFTYKEDGIEVQVRYNLDEFIKFQEKKISETAYLGDEYNFPGEFQYWDEECEEWSWIEDIDYDEVISLNPDFEVTWTKKGDTKVLAEGLAYEFIVESADDFGVYCQNISYKGHYCGKIKYTLEEDTWQFISKNGKTTSDNPAKGDARVKIYDIESTKNVQVGEDLFLNVWAEAQQWNSKWGEWEYVDASSKLAFKWYKGTKALSGKTGDYLDFTVKSSDLGADYKCKLTYKFTSKIKKAAGSAVIHIKEGLGINYAWIDGSTCIQDGQSAKFSVDAYANAEGAEFSYQWYKLDINEDDDEELEIIEGATSKDYVSEPLEYREDPYDYACKLTVTAPGTEWEPCEAIVHSNSVWMCRCVGSLGEEGEFAAKSDYQELVEFTPYDGLGWYEVIGTSDADYFSIDGIVDEDGFRLDQYMFTNSNDNALMFKLPEDKSYYLLVSGGYDNGNDYTFSLTSEKKIDPSVKAGSLPLKVKQTIKVKNNIVLDPDDGLAFVGSSNKKIAKIVTGNKVKGVKAGTALIYAYTDGGDYLEFEVKVQKTAVACAELTIGCENEVTLLKGQKLKINAAKAPITCAKAFSYKTSKKTVATVSGGTITAKALGDATITVKCGTKSQKILVHVVNK